MSVVIEVVLGIWIAFLVVEIIDLLVKSAKRQLRLGKEALRIAALQEDRKSGSIGSDELSVAIFAYFSDLAIESYEDVRGLRSVIVSIILIAISLGVFFILR